MNDCISRKAVLQKFLERGSGYIDMPTMKTMVDEIPAADVQPYIKELELEKKKLEAMVVSKDMEIDALEKLNASLEKRIADIKEQILELFERMDEEDKQ